MKREMRWAIGAIVGLAVAVGAAAGAPAVVWIEAEKHDECNFKHFETSNMGKPALLSGGEWIMKGVAAEEVAKLVPTEGIVLKYKLRAPQAGRYELWGRLGWFHSRANLRWRLGNGPWREAPASMPTINLMELGFFCEASWWDLGAVDLPAGETTLELNYPKVADGTSRMLVALDCLAFVRGPFTPAGPLRPGQTYDGELDRKAASHVFRMPAPEGVGRVESSLVGPWQVARYDDPNMDKDTYEPVAALPKGDEYELRWMGFEAPGSPWKVEPLVFGHRLIYRTRVDVPAGHAGRGMKLHFSGTNWIVSVFVNGKLAGTHTGVWVPWDLDVTKHIEPGKTNEIALAVKGTYYAMDAPAMGNKSLMAHSNRPRTREKWTRWVAPIYPSVKGDGDGYEYGIVNPVKLVSMGEAYTADVFIKPSVARKRLETDVTVHNASARARSLQVVCEAVEDAGGKVAKSFGPVAAEVPAGADRTVVVAGDWADPKLWWPQPNPPLYRLRTTLSEGGKVLDVQEELFGFREVTIRGPGIYINGVRRNIWNWVDVHARSIEKPQQWAEAFRQEGNRFMRFSHGRRITQALPTREQRLEFYDRSGIPGRLCTMIDGMFISFNLGERTKQTGPDGKPVLKPNEKVWESFRRHMAQVARAYRNHPSVILYQVENELVYINGMNIYGAYLDKVEDLMGEVCEAGRKEDPTRPYTVGGGGDLSGRLEINSPHYPATSVDYYPDNAYTLAHYSEKIQRWPWDRKKPWVVGESLFADELRLGAYVAGDEVFRGMTAALKGKAKFLRMIYGGYRWAGVAGFFPWDNLWQFDDTRKIFSDLYAVPRRQTSRLFAGQTNRLLFKVMNDTLSAEPVTLEWSYAADGRRVAGGKVALKIEPGFGAEQTLEIAAPAVEKRTEGVLTLKLTQPGAAVYVDERSVPVLPTGKAPVCKAPLWVLDREGSVAGWLARAGLKLEKIDSLDAARDKQGVLLIGSQTLTPAEAFGPALLGFAVRGGRVICLDQSNPPAGSALPTPIRPSTHFGGFAHPQALGTEIFRDLGADDLIDWAAGGPVYHDVYLKPSQGARSLAQAGADLELSPLVEVPCGEGAIVLCQFRVAANLGADPAAEILLRNLLDVYGGYRPVAGMAALCSGGDDLLESRAAAAGILMEKTPAVADALDRARYAVALVKGTEANLRALLASQAKADAFQAAGGWIVLCGVGPDGIDEFNRLVGADHMLRPFRIERVTLENPHDPLAATLGNRDVALQSANPLQHGRYWISGNTFSHVIDGRDFAPFTQPPGGPEDPHEYKPAGDDHDPFNFVNGMLRSDHWRYIRQIWIPETGAEPLTFRLRRPEMLDTIKVWNNDTYWTIEKLDVILDGDEAGALHMTLPDSDDVTVLKLPRPAKVAKTITLQIRTWRQRPLKRADLRLVGIDNVQFLRPAAPKAVPLDSVGGLVAFRKGRGGVFLNQVKFMADEPRKTNDAQKVRILGVLLQNMGVGFRSAAVVAVPGVNVRFAPVSLQEYGTGFLDARSGKAGWFGAKGEDLSALPRGSQVLADVTYHVVDYATAPTPDAVLLGGKKNPVRALRDLPEAVRGIKVARKADLLYFLHTACVARPVTDRERQQMNDKRRPFQLPELARYVVHYADGKTAEIPVVLERSVDHWVQAKPASLPEARLAWSHAVEALAGSRACLYSMQVPNPRPDVEIATIDVVPGGGANRAALALVAVSTGQVIHARKAGS